VSQSAREMTAEECRAIFLEQIAAMVGYCLAESRAATTREKLNGLVFSILVMIDGGSILPAFDLIPRSSEGDREFFKGEGQNWWPEGCNISGGLHELWHQFEPKR
jgi:hypothetical protein